MIRTETFLCPVCGYPDLKEAPWTDGVGSLDICPSCGTQFGYSDAAGGDAARRAGVHRERRRGWIDAGSPWSAPGEPPPGWDPAAQLKPVLESERCCDD